MPFSKFLIKEIKQYYNYDNHGNANNHLEIDNGYFGYNFSSIGTIYETIEYFEKYRFGFNGQEKDDEVAGAGNTNTAMFWEYDTRLGRRWNLDPKPQINISDYAVMGDNPIQNLDLFGDTWVNEAQRERKNEEVNIVAAKDNIETLEFNMGTTQRLVDGSINIGQQIYYEKKIAEANTIYQETEAKLNKAKMNEAITDKILCGIKTNYPDLYEKYDKLPGEFRIVISDKLLDYRDNVTGQLVFSSPEQVDTWINFFGGTDKKNRPNVVTKATIHFYVKNSSEKNYQLMVHVLGHWDYYETTKEKNQNKEDSENCARRWEGNALEYPNNCE